MAESLKDLDLRTEVEITEKSRWHVSTEVNWNIKDVTEDLEIKESETNTPLWYNSGVDTCVPQSAACYKNNAEKAFWKVLSEQHPHFSCKIVFAIMDNKEKELSIMISIHDIMHCSFVDCSFNTSSILTVKIFCCYFLFFETCGFFQRDPVNEGWLSLGLWQLYVVTP